MHTLHDTHEQCHLNLRKKKSGPLLSGMMDDSAPTHEIVGNSLLPSKICSLENELWLLKHAGRSTLKNIKMMK